MSRKVAELRKLGKLRKLGELGKLEKVVLTEMEVRKGDWV